MNGPRIETTQERAVQADRVPMRAVVERRYGGPEVLHLQRVPRPTIGAHEVLVRLHGAGVARGTVGTAGPRSSTV